MPELAWLWQFRRWAGGAVTIVLLGGMIYSSVNYYTAPPYDKGDMAGMGQLLDEKGYRAICCWSSRRFGDVSSATICPWTTSNVGSKPVN